MALVPEEAQVADGSWPRGSVHGMHAFVSRHLKILSGVPTKTANARREPLSWACARHAPR
jgi:hypothetical protein